jgi:hypothetical protein
MRTKEDAGGGTEKRARGGKEGGMDLRRCCLKDDPLFSSDMCARPLPDPHFPDPLCPLVKSDKSTTCTLTPRPR